MGVIGCPWSAKLYTQHTQQRGDLAEGTNDIDGNPMHTYVFQKGMLSKIDGKQ